MKKLPGHSSGRSVSAWIGRELLREALHRHLVRLQAEGDIQSWLAVPLTDDETAFSEIADWGPAEDWSDWSDATG